MRQNGFDQATSEGIKPTSLSEVEAVCHSISIRVIVAFEFYAPIFFCVVLQQ